MSILDELEWRGLINDCTDTEALTERIGAGSVVLYCGFDPTSDSLHVGNLVPLIALRDAFAVHKAGDDSALRGLLRPLEELLQDLPRMELKDSAVDAVCHGADLGGPGVVAVSSSLRRGQLVALLTLHGEAVALARATRHADELPGAEGTVARLERVLMERSTYPRQWKSRTRK